MYKATSKWEEVYIYIYSANGAGTLKFELTKQTLFDWFSCIQCHWYWGGTLSFSLTLSSLKFLIAAASRGFNTGGTWCYGKEFLETRLLIISNAFVFGATLCAVILCFALANFSHFSLKDHWNFCLLPCHQVPTTMYGKL